VSVYQLASNIPNLPETGSYWIAPNATVIGNVHFDPGVSIWFGAVVRGDNERIRIGSGSNIQDNAVLHSDPGFPLSIGENCTIGHGAIIHGCTLGNSTLVGMGATILNGARLGANCLIGANALITENATYPDNSLILGAPAKRVRELDQQAIQSLPKLARHYVENWQHFARNLREI
jgi:carbonic anhydrase/acetyltransferase-like protein (isoleucine patch superfamily)